jgi:hypothetical protein
MQVSKGVKERMNVQFGAKFAVIPMSSRTREDRPQKSKPYLYMAKNLPEMMGSLRRDGFHGVEMNGANVHIRIQPTPFSNQDGSKAYGAAVSFKDTYLDGQQLLPALLVKRGDEQTIYTGQDYNDEMQRLSNHKKRKKTAEPCPPGGFVPIGPFLA